MQHRGQADAVSASSNLLSESTEIKIGLTDVKEMLPPPPQGVERLILWKCICARKFTLPPVGTFYS